MSVFKVVRGALYALSFLLVLILWWLLVHKLSPKDVSDAATALALLVGGGWTFYQFALRKSFESALSLDYKVQTESYGSHFVVSFEVLLANIGNRRITSPPALTKSQIEDYENTVLYPADLQVRKLADGLAAPGFAGWWPENKKIVDLPDVPPHISLLYDYTRSDGEIDFFMEPAEEYSVGAILLLPQGHYAAKIVFVGERAKASEYWCRIVYFRVPTPRPIPSEPASPQQAK